MFMDYFPTWTAIIGKIGMIHFNLTDIMADTDCMKALTTFINRTQRLKD